MKHQAIVVKESVRNTGHGIAFTLRCCEGENAMESSVHLQNAGRYSQDELARVIGDYLEEHAQRHQDHLAAVAFVEKFAQEGCPCAQASNTSAGESGKPSASAGAASAATKS